MKKHYTEPETLIVATGAGYASPLCASTDSLSPLQEKNDLEGMSWNYKS